VSRGQPPRAWALALPDTIRKYVHVLRTVEPVEPVGGVRRRRAGVAGDRGHRAIS
jgi:hypothetical protein